ncbi:ATP-binding cassette domain-containing protein [Vibrio maerlii]|uniref:ATP-binding cassette domain-containing protein n=1 Tax=Vibrio maerlii TaxID=2231648 RepID=UPI000E3C1C66|nr:ATP-binding cassette domain-containing protein [Vibrio maerlii]
MSLCLTNLAIRNSVGDVLFSNLNLNVEAGELVTLMGPSGCGKSTLLDVIAGHLADEFTANGEVSLNNEKLNNVSPHLREVGILFQEDLLFPHLNVWQNLAFALPNCVKGSERYTQAIHALEQIDLAALADSYPDQISGGQRARIALTRMLLAKPKAVLLDEPFSKLDQDSRKQFRTWVFGQLKQANIPALMVTHDISDVPENGKVLSWPWESTHA